MSQVATSGPETRAVAERKPSAPTKDIDTLLKRAGEGDRGCLSEVQALLADPDDGPDYRKGFGSSAEWLRQSIIRKSAGKNVLSQKAIDQELDRIRSELDPKQA